MRTQQLLAALLCTVTLLSGCGAAAGIPAHSSDPGQGGETASREQSEVEFLNQQAAQWEATGLSGEEELYRESLNWAMDLARADSRKTYWCNNPSTLGDAEREALTDAALRCNYAYSIFRDFEPFSQEDVHATIGMLLLYTPGTLEVTACWNMDGSVPGLPEGNYCRVKKADLLPFLERTLVPAARAYQEYGASSMEEWNWHETEDGYVYVDVTGLTATLPYHLPQFIGIEPLGGDRYLVRCEMIGITHFPMVMVVEDDAQTEEDPHVVVLDCISGGTWNEDAFLPTEEVNALRDQYWLLGKGGQEALEVLKRLEGLSPIPFRTDLAGQMSPAMEQALSDVKIASELATRNTFEAYVQSLQIPPAMHRYSEAEEWIPSDPEYKASYGDEWNLYPAEDLEKAFQMRFGIDLTANDRSWLNDRIFVPSGEYTDGPMAVYDGENYCVYTRGIGYMASPYKTSLTYNYDRTYTAVFTEVERGATTMLQLRNVGTREEPFFQIQGYYGLPE